MQKTIVVLPGDGIGPEIAAQAERVLNQVASVFHHDFSFSAHLIGGPAIEAAGCPLPEPTLEACLQSDAVLLGAVDASGDRFKGPTSPESGLRRLRRSLGLFANVRPASRRSSALTASPSRAGSATGPMDLIVVREMFSGVPVDRHGSPRKDTSRESFDAGILKSADVRRIARLAFRLAQSRRRSVVSVHPADSPESSKIWREAMTETAAEHPEVELRHLVVEEAALRIVHDPGDFDVIVAPNRCADILSEMAGMAAGSPGLCPSATLGEGSRGLYEPSQRSNPDLAGRDAANPIPAILSAAMMLRYSFALENESEAVERAVTAIRASNYRTEDVMSEGRTRIGTDGLGRLIAEAVGGA
ncbi:MAG: isocitrate/isopropylmalate family dehydrogenase [Candidatus Aminicenantes bacterium]|nr:isocitrate/isopropylmalate family dehydrogenase [Candidatus Aminicenantes bacterium]